jgi:ribonuclease HI
MMPGHRGIPENEEADKLAKEGTNGDPPDQIVGIPFVVDEEVIRSH